MKKGLEPENIAPPKLSFFKKVFYTIAGYPPRPVGLPDDTWKKWNDRFQTPEYDWKHHSGVHGDTQQE